MTNLPMQLDSLLALLQRGGPVVWLLILLSFVALVLVLAKTAQFWRLGMSDGEDVLEESQREWRRTRWSESARLLENLPRHPASRVMNAAMQGLLADQGEIIVREEISRIAKNQIERLRSGLRVLELIASLSPLLGLLGTVLGMIVAFQRLESAGNQVDPALLSGGIWQALLTTAVGLIVAIPVLVAHQWLDRRVERCAHQMEDHATRVFTSFAIIRKSSKKR